MEGVPFTRCPAPRSSQQPFCTLRLQAGGRGGWHKLHARAKGGKGTLWRGYMQPPPSQFVQPFTPRSEHVANAAQVDKGGGYVGKRDRKSVV